MSTIAEEADLSFPEINDLLHFCEEHCVIKGYCPEKDATEYEFKDGSCIAINDFLEVETYNKIEFF